jgi:acetyltransferase
MDSSRQQEGTVMGRVARARHAGTSGAIAIRAAHPCDAEAIQRFVRGLSRESRRRRFFAPIHELSPEQLDRLTSTASADDLSLLVLDGDGKIIGMGQCAATGGGAAEFAVVVADDWQQRGIGAILLRLLLEHARSRRLVSLAGFVLSENQAMLGLAAKLGLSLARDVDPALMRVEMTLGESVPSGMTARLHSSLQAA